jgi:hypothetical protein
MGGVENYHYSLGLTNGPTLLRQKNLKEGEIQNRRSVRRRAGREARRVRARRRKSMRMMIFEMTAPNLLGTVVAVLLDK